jgi:hypothetical protein
MIVLLYYYLLVRSARTPKKKVIKLAFLLFSQHSFRNLKFIIRTLAKKENDNLIQKICDDNTCIIRDVLKYQLVE